MKPALQLKTSFTWTMTVLLLASILSTGCSLTDSLPGSKQLKDLIPGGEDEQQQALLGATEGIGEVRGNIPSVLPLRATEEELQKSMLQSSPRQYYRPTSG